jgi:glycosyltransferase involved in cell wall biosynthesis
VGGNPQGLSRHLRLLGVQSETWVLEQNYLAYRCDRVIWSPPDGIIARELRRWRAIFDALLFADVLHFNFGTSLAYPVQPRSVTEKKVARKLARRLFSAYTKLLQLIELNLYRMAGIPMFVHYQGDDARQGDESLARFKVSIAANVGEGYYDRSSDDFKRRMIRRMARYCEAIYTVNPDLMHVLPPSSQFVPYSHISLLEWLPLYPDPNGTAPLRIGHAPSHRAVKGTDLLLRAIEALRKEGHIVELVLVEGTSHESAKRQYQSVDVLVDQLFAGWYGALAVEAMALGKPVMVYIRQEDLHFIPAEMRCELPFFQVEPDTILDGLRTIVTMPRSELHAIGRRSRAFVERWHDPRTIAASMKAAYEGALRRRGRIAAH